MKSGIKQIDYYRECYEADSRELNITNIFQRNIEHRCFMEEEGLLNDQFSRMPVPYDIAEAINKTLSIYLREKTLIYCSFFLVGSKNNKSIYGPLIITEATLEKDKSHWFIKAAIQQSVVNYPLLRLIADCENNESGLSINESECLQAFIGDYNPVSIRQFFDRLNIPIDTFTMSSYPKLLQEAEMKALPIKNNFHLCPVSAIGVVKRAVGSRGILDELDQLSVMKNKDLSLPLRQVLQDGDKKNIKGRKPKPAYVPGVLNPAQKKAMLLAAEKSLSVVNGPPGTGKSHTIAAICIDRFNQGESVLIATKTDQSIDVVSEKLSKHLKNTHSFLRVGSSAYHRQLKKHVSDILNGIYKVEDKRVNKIKKSIGKLLRRIKKLEKIFNRRCKRSLKWGAILAGYDGDTTPGGLWKRMKLWHIKRKIIASELHWQLVETVSIKQSQLDKLTGEYVISNYLQRLDETLQKNRQQLVNYHQAIKARTSSRQEKYFSAIDRKILLSTFPIWLSTLSDLYRSIPFEKELFDVAIIDEATQSDIASCLPLLQRAKRVIVVGDPKQLRHVSFLSKSREQSFRERFSLATDQVVSYRDTSILDLCIQRISSQDNLVLLNEHFRSRPEIIQFSNKKFYHNRLRLMTQRPGLNDKNAIITHILNGKHDKRGLNRKESDAIINTIRGLIAQNFHHDAYRYSIGILSPFSDQAQYLQKQLVKHFSSVEIEQHQLMASTAYGFQGEERDIMLLSFAVDSQTIGRTYAYLNRQDMFNVAVTRARSKQQLFLSVPLEDIKYKSLLGEYIEYTKTYQSSVSKNIYQRDAFHDQVHAELLSLEVDVWPAYSVGGELMDMVCSYNGQLLAIDLIGYPGDFAKFYTIERYKLFHRCGLKVFPLAYGVWVFNKKLVINVIKKLLGIQ